MGFSTEASEALALLRREMVRIYAVNSGFYNTINRVYAKYFGVNSPARSFVPVASWPMEFDIEIECVAVT